MLAPPAPGQQRWTRRFALTAAGLTVGASLALGIATSVVRVPTRPADPAGSVGEGSVDQPRDEFVVYLQAVKPLAVRGGEVVQRGLKAGVTDIATRRFDDRTLVAMAGAWVTDLERVRDALAEVHAPAFLTRAHQMQVAALDEYVAAARTLRDAARALAPNRSGLALRAAAQGERADRTWDRADEILAGYRASLGLPPGHRAALLEGGG
jgi:non-ribosomal peptide synthetase component F